MITLNEYIANLQEFAKEHGNLTLFKYDDFDCEYVIVQEDDIAEPVIIYADAKRERAEGIDLF